MVVISINYDLKIVQSKDICVYMRYLFAYMRILLIFTWINNKCQVGLIGVTHVGN